MFELLPVVALITTKIWYFLPLLVSVSLVYAATRHELLTPILAHAVRFALWIIVFMGVVFGIVYLMQLAV
jgi:hypothetical protein